MPKAGAKGGKKKANNLYRMPDPLPKGLILEDILKKKWKLGKSIGKGGFGEIYEAQDASKSASNYPYVIKIEPHENGPLFVEMHFYMRVGKPADIEEFKKSRGLKSFGMPPHFGHGSQEYDGQRYRFIVMEKYGTDIAKLYLENNQCFPEATVFKLGLQIVDVLEYIHGKGYTHADIKGGNLLLGSNNQVYLVDFGLASKYKGDKEFIPDPKKAHDGTIEYLSWDAHCGVQTRRGDLEILLYNLLRWLGCKLPWEDCLNNPVAVKESKKKHMDDSSLLIKACFGSKTPPKAILEYIKYFKQLKHYSEPDYDALRSILRKGLKDAGGDVKSPLKFTAPTPRKRKSEPLSTSPEKKRKVDEEEAGDDELATQSSARKKVKPKRTPKGSQKSKRTPQKQGRNLTSKKLELEEANGEENGGSDSNESGTSETAAMKEIRTKMSKKNGTKKAVPSRKKEVPQSSIKNVDEVSSSTRDVPISAGRGRRNLPPVNYNESPRSRRNRKVSEHEDVDDIISGTEDEATPGKSKRKAVPKVK